MKHYTQEDDKKYKDELRLQIAELKKDRNAVIIVHNYQRDEVQEIADVSGDSLALSKAAVRTDADVIVFCGVHFMAETASILNPHKTILLPVKEAGCPMADMITVDMLKKKRAEYPDAAVVCYVNSAAAVKAESDICCTSSNAVEIVRSLKEKRILFIPDKNLGRYVQTQVKNKEIICWEGFCPTHVRVHEDQVKVIKNMHPNAKFIAHPECDPPVLELADHITSTSGMIKYVDNSDASDFIIGTEYGMLFRLQQQFPDKKFYVPTEGLLCANMKLTTLGWVAHALEFMEHEVKVEEEIRVRAKVALDRMLGVSGEKKWVSVSGN